MAETTLLAGSLRTGDTTRTLACGVQLECRGASMQACCLSSSLPGQPALLADLSCVRAPGDFSNALIESMLGAQPAASTKDADGKKVAGKHDPKIESGAPDGDADEDEATAAATVIIASLPPPVAPTPLADPTVAAPHVENSAATIAGELSASLDRAIQGRTSTGDRAAKTQVFPLVSSVVPLATTFASRTPIFPRPNISAKEKLPTDVKAIVSKVAAQPPRTTKEPPAPVAADALGIAAGDRQSTDIGDPTLDARPSANQVPVFATTQVRTQDLVATGKSTIPASHPQSVAVQGPGSGPSAILQLFENRQGAPRTALSAVPSDGDSSLPAPLLPATTEGASSARPVIASPLTPDESSSTSTSAPEVSEQSLQVATAQDNPISVSEPAATTVAKAFQVGPAKTKSSVSAIGDEIRSAVSGAAQAHGQIFAESAAIHATPRVTPAEPGESKDASEKKSPVAPAQERPSSHETQGSQVRDDGVTAVVPREMASAAPPPPHASSAETREVPNNPQMPDSALAADKTLPNVRVATDAGGEVQIRVGMRTAAFGAVEIYTSVHQNQVGIAVHGEREMARWFGAEVQNIESGLKDHHLHLSSMEMDRGGAGLQTSTGSHQQNPQRNFQAMKGWPTPRTLEREEVERVEVVPAGPPVWPGENHVSIRI